MQVPMTHTKKLDLRIQYLCLLNLWTLGYLTFRFSLKRTYIQGQENSRAFKIMDLYSNLIESYLIDVIAFSIYFSLIVFVCDYLEI